MGANIFVAINSVRVRCTIKRNCQQFIFDDVTSQEDFCAALTGNRRGNECHEWYWNWALKSKRASNWHQIWGQNLSSRLKEFPLAI